MVFYFIVICSVLVKRKKIMSKTTCLGLINGLLNLNMQSLKDFLYIYTDQLTINWKTVHTDLTYRNTYILKQIYKTV